MIVDTITGEIISPQRAARFRRNQKKIVENYSYGKPTRSSVKYVHATYRRRSRKQPNPLTHILISLTALGIAALAISTL